MMHTLPDEPLPKLTPSTIVVHFAAHDFPVVEATYFRPVIAETVEVSLYLNSDGERYIGRIQLRGRAAKKDGTPGNAAGNLWFTLGSHGDEPPAWLLDLVQKHCADWV
jgi:hypothetical protein